MYRQDPQDAFSNEEREAHAHAIDFEGCQCPDCGRSFNSSGACNGCGLTLEDLEAAADYFDSLEYDDDREYDPFLTDAEADADVLRSAGMGTDEDYYYDCPGDYWEQ